MGSWQCRTQIWVVQNALVAQNSLRGKPMVASQNVGCFLRQVFVQNHATECFFKAQMQTWQSGFCRMLSLSCSEILEREKKSLGSKREKTKNKKPLNNLQFTLTESCSQERRVKMFFKRSWESQNKKQILKCLSRENSKSNFKFIRKFS